MKSIPIKVQKISKDVLLPERKTKGSAGYDVYAYLPQKSVVVPKGKIELIPTGLFLEIPENYEIEIRPRSGLSTKNYLLIPNSPGTIDSDYRGQLFIPMLNLSDSDFEVIHQMRIAQMFIRESFGILWNETDSINSTDRNSQGFGSTGL